VLLFKGQQLEASLLYNVDHNDNSSLEFGAESKEAKIVVVGVNDISAKYLKSVEGSLYQQESIYKLVITPCDV